MTDPNPATLARLRKARTQLIIDNRFFGSLACRLDFEEDPSEKTLSTDGVKIFYNPAYVDSLSADHLKGVMCHEVMHLAAGHHTRRESRNTSDWNKAADYAINGMLLKSGVSLPPGYLHSADYDGMSAEQIYRKIATNNEHGLDPDPGNSGGVRDYPGDGDGPATQAENDAQAAKWKIDAAQALAISKAAGCTPGGADEFIRALKTPRLDWREVLRRYVATAARNDYTWRRPNKRYMSTGIILPSLYNEQLAPLVVAVDTSCSVSNEELTQFAAEIEAIIQDHQTAAIVVCCDTEVNNVETFTPDSLPVTMNAKGRGGTRFAPVFDYCRILDFEPSVIVYLSDMECDDFGHEPDAPVLWISTGQDCPVPFGEVVCMF